MDRILKEIIVLTLVSTIIIKCECNKNCIQTNYNFSIGIKAYPDLDSIYINDTVWLEIDESVFLNDISSGNSIDFSKARDLGSAIGFQEVITNVQFRNAANDFKYKLVTGTETINTNPELFREYLFNETAGRYLFKIGIIPQQKGIYRLVVSNANNVIRKEGDCEKANFIIDFRQTNQHFYLYPGGAGTPPGGNTYYFKVK
ncbi:MAG: hypothetical protein ABUT20_15600 [Bacteroidota bacterium]